MRVVAPSGAVPRATFLAGIAALGDRYRLVFDDSLFATAGYLAGDDERRLGELEDALADDQARGVFCARGGYGMMRLLHRLDLRRLAVAPKVVVGFSDLTALHAVLYRAGWVSVHGPTVTQMSVLPREDMEHLFALLEDAAPAPRWTCRPLAGGQAEGPLVGGNLELVTRLLGTPHLPPLDGTVLAFEEVGERPYRIDRSLTQLGLAGVWRRVVAVVVGDLTRCTNDPPAPPSAEEVVAERLAGLGLPVVVAAPFGHGVRHRAFAHGGRVHVDGVSGSVTWLEGAVDD